MRYKGFLSGSILTKRWIYVALLGLGFSGCATTDTNYAYRNNIDSARSRCADLAQTSGYRDVAVDSINRDGQAEWKVTLVVRKDGKNSKERCEYNARTDRAHMDD
jgi:hypothetical protein